ncbi:hypothetical protein AAC387_Pa07g0066 [Persea americana]
MRNAGRSKKDEDRERNGENEMGRILTCAGGGHLFVFRIRLLNANCFRFTSATVYDDLIDPSGPYRRESSVVWSSVEEV